MSDVLLQFLDALGQRNGFSDVVRVVGNSKVNVMRDENERLAREVGLPPEAEGLRLIR
jgi:hypothetical protein